MAPKGFGGFGVDRIGEIAQPGIQPGISDEFDAGKMGVDAGWCLFLPSWKIWKSIGKDYIIIMEKKGSKPPTRDFSRIIMQIYGGSMLELGTMISICWDKHCEKAFCFSTKNTLNSEYLYLSDFL